MKESVKAVAVLTVLCMVIAGILGAANYVTAGKIAENNQKALENARSAVLPEGNYSFREIDSKMYGESAGTVTAAWEAVSEGKTVGYVFRMETKGYAAGLVLTCGISTEGTVTGTATVSTNETPSLGGKTQKPAYADQYLGKHAGELQGIDAVSGATKTSNAYRNAVSDAFRAYEAIRSVTGGNDQ